MKIERLNQLLKFQSPQAVAWIPEKSGQRQTQVNIRFFQNSKVYTYNDTILGVADRLGLIPEIDVNQEAEDAVTRLQNGASPLVHIQTVDTVRHLAYPTRVGEEDAGQDEFGHKLVRITQVESDPWVE